MKKKTSNILICILAVVALGCGIMAAGTMGGWFGGGDEEISKTAQTEVSRDASAEKEDAESAAQSDAKAEKAENKDAEKASGKGRCTITIKCTSILKNMNKLESGKEKYVPSNGIILSTSTVEFREGETVYDILKRSCSAAGIPLSARSSSMGVYVEGINGIFEFDCGGSSGWMYSVNGAEPNHSCAKHAVKDGDSIIWYYTCGK